MIGNRITYMINAMFHGFEDFIIFRQINRNVKIENKVIGQTFGIFVANKDILVDVRSDYSEQLPTPLNHLHFENYWFIC